MTELALVLLDEGALVYICGCQALMYFKLCQMSFLYNPKYLILFSLQNVSKYWAFFPSQNSKFCCFFRFYLLPIEQNEFSLNHTLRHI